MARANALALQSSRSLPIAPRIMIGFARGDSAEQQALLREYEGIGAPAGTNDYIITALREFSLAEQLLGMPRADVVQQAAAHTVRAVLSAARGRWSEARLEFEKAERLDPRSPPVLRALCAALPFLGVPAADVAAARDAIARWNPPADDGPAAVASIAAALDPHRRMYLLGLLSSRLGEEDAALRRAAELERLPTRDGTRALVRGLAATVRADVLRARGALTDALRELEQVRGEVPLELIPVPGFGEEYARYLRADVLHALDRGNEALPWLEHGLAASHAPRTEFPLYAPFELLQAQIHEELGDGARATQHYARFLDYWRDPDPALEPVVASARTHLARLTADQPAR